MLTSSSNKSTQKRTAFCYSLVTNYHTLTDTVDVLQDDWHILLSIFNVKIKHSDSRRWTIRLNTIINKCGDIEWITISVFIDQWLHSSRWFSHVKMVTNIRRYIYKLSIRQDISMLLLLRLWNIDHSKSMLNCLLTTINKHFQLTASNCWHSANKYMDGWLKNI